MTIKLYADKNHYEPSLRPYLTIVLKALWSDLPEPVRTDKYGSLAEVFKAAPTAGEADLHLLPLKWNYYVEHSALGKAVRAAEEARRNEKRIVVFSEGDFAAQVPMDNAVLFELSTHRSRTGIRNFGFPTFFQDLLGPYGKRHAYRSKSKKPVVGFCGQAAHSTTRLFAREVIHLARKAVSHLGYSSWIPSATEHTGLRRRILEQLSRSALVESKFIIRERYRAGVKAPKEKHDPYEPSRLEFIDNILETDYTVCVRGRGNFSKRLYETLCLGRIPILVDTDCVLPYERSIDWRQFCVWVDQSEIGRIDKKVAEFHEALSDDDFQHLQRACRQLWLDRLCPEGFFRHFGEHFPDL